MFNKDVLCEAPLVMHLNFVDDVHLFFDGEESSHKGFSKSLMILSKFLVWV